MSQYMDHEPSAPQRTEADTTPVSQNTLHRRKFLGGAVLYSGLVVVAGYFGAEAALYISSRGAPVASGKATATCQEGLTAEQAALKARQDAAIASYGKCTDTLTESIIEAPGAVTSADNGIGDTMLTVKPQGTPQGAYQLKTIYGVDANEHFIPGTVRTMQLSDAQILEGSSNTVPVERSLQYISVQRADGQNWSLEIQGEQNKPIYSSNTTSGPSAEEVSNQLQLITSFADRALRQVPEPVN
jgi:hypothetical protein